MEAIIMKTLARCLGAGLAAVAVPAFLGFAALADSRIEAGGSTFIYPLMSKWASEYAKQSTVQVNYQSIGSGGGIQQTISKIFDFGCTDAPLNAEQDQKAKASGGEVVHVPLSMGAVVPAYVLPGITEPLKFDGQALAGIFLGKITAWNDPALKALNPGVNLPDTAITVVHRSDGSGTSFIWSDYLSKVSDEWKNKVGAATSLNWPAGVGQKGNEGVAGQITRTPGAIGYVELIYALQNKIPYGLVQNKEGKFIKGSLDSVTAAANGALKEIPADLRYSLTNAPGAESYPISGTTWAILYVDQPKDKMKEVTGFLEWALHDGQKYSGTLNYAPLPQGLVEKAEAKLKQVKAAG
jgi:phosphate transport system substrate-binding protein